MNSNPFERHKGINNSSFTIDVNFCQTFGTFWGRKEAEAGIDCVRCMGAWMRQDWIGIHIDKNEYWSPAPHAVWTNVHNIHGDGMGTIYREDETLNARNSFAMVQFLYLLLPRNKHYWLQMSNWLWELRPGFLTTLMQDYALEPMSHYYRDIH